MKKHVTYLILVSLILISCSDNVKEKYERTKQLNTVAVYEAFIKENYQSHYADSALLQIQNLEFNQALTVHDFKKFLKKYPKSSFSDSAATRIHVINFKHIDDDIPLTKQRIQELTNYLKKYPEGFYAKSVTEKINLKKEKAKRELPPPPPVLGEIEVIEDESEVEETIIESTFTDKDAKTTIEENRNSTKKSSAKIVPIKSYEACGNCLEAALKKRTFGGSNELVINNTNYVFYAFYTPNERACYGQNEASIKVANAFARALEKDKMYNQIINDFKSKGKRLPYHKYKLSGKIVHNSTNYKQILKPFEDSAERIGNQIKYIEIDVDFKAIFDVYPICN